MQKDLKKFWTPHQQKFIAIFFIFFIYFHFLHAPKENPAPVNARENRKKFMPTVSNGLLRILFF